MTPRDPQRDPITLPDGELTFGSTMRSRTRHGGSRARPAPTSSPLGEVGANVTPHTRSRQLSEKRWWTDADQAELEVLIDAFVRGVLDHRARCPHCTTHEPWCENLRDAFDVVLEWRNTRARRSRAFWLREEADEVEAEVERVRARRHQAAEPAGESRTSAAVQNRCLPDRGANCLPHALHAFTETYTARGGKRKARDVQVDWSA